MIIFSFFLFTVYKLISHVVNANMIEKHDGAWSPSHHKADIPSEQVVFPSTLAVAHMESGKRFNKSDL